MCIRDRNYCSDNSCQMVQLAFDYVVSKWSPLVEALGLLAGDIIQGLHKWSLHWVQFSLSLLNLGSPFLDIGNQFCPFLWAFFNRPILHTSSIFESIVNKCFAKQENSHSAILLIPNIFIRFLHEVWQRLTQGVIAHPARGIDYIYRDASYFFCNNGGKEHTRYQTN